MNDGWTPPRPSPISRLEKIALGIVPELADLDLDERADRCARTCIARSAAVFRRDASDRDADVALCGETFQLARRSGNGAKICRDCRVAAAPSFDPGPREIAWVERIPDASLDDLLGALALPAPRRPASFRSALLNPSNE
jgi:hypothetical protein